ncbi:MAG: hypothetical protein JXX14_22510 [Deltaproteobacteria bacterium]|nr:hypothetical protein [Deltaproteobacteria bacterium]
MTKNSARPPISGNYSNARIQIHAVIALKWQIFGMHLSQLISLHVTFRFFSV